MRVWIAEIRFGDKNGIWARYHMLANNFEEATEKTKKLIVKDNPEKDIQVKMQIVKVEEGEFEIDNVE